MSLRSLCKELVFALREAFVLGEGAGRGAGRHRLQPCWGAEPPLLPLTHSRFASGLFPHPWGCSGALQPSGTVVWALLPTHGVVVPWVHPGQWHGEPSSGTDSPQLPPCPIPPARAHPHLTQVVNIIPGAARPHPRAGIPALGTQQRHPEMCGECRRSRFPPVQGDADQGVISAGSRLSNPSV